MDVTIAVSTYGDPEWIKLAHDRAIPSAQAQGVRVVHQHADTLHDARNASLAAVTSEWVVFLDADDELEDGYVDAMAVAQGDVRVPCVAYVHRGRRRVPYMPKVAGHDHVCIPDCLTAGNWIVVGAAVRAALVRQVGGWRDYAVYEDWDLFQRCWLAGADIQAAPGAVYRAHVRTDSRNRAPDIAFKNRVHAEIVAANMPFAAGGIKAAA